MDIWGELGPGAGTARAGFEVAPAAALELADEACGFCGFVGILEEPVPGAGAAGATGATGATGAGFAAAAAVAAVAPPTIPDEACRRKCSTVCAAATFGAMPASTRPVKCSLNARCMFFQYFVRLNQFETTQVQ